MTAPGAGRVQSTCDSCGRTASALTLYGLSLLCTPCLTAPHRHGPDMCPIRGCEWAACCCPDHLSCSAHPGRENHCMTGRCGLCWLCREEASPSPWCWSIYQGATCLMANGHSPGHAGSSFDGRWLRWTDADAAAETLALIEREEAPDA